MKYLQNSRSEGVTMFVRFFCLLCICLSLTVDVYAQKLTVRADAFSIVSKVGTYDPKISGAPVYRAINLNNGGEGTQWLVIEKYLRAEYDVEEKIFYQQKFDIRKIEAVIKALDDHFRPQALKLGRKEIIWGEASYGCCSPSALRWEGPHLKFKLKVVKKHLSCNSSDVTKTPIKLSCK